MKQSEINMKSETAIKKINIKILALKKQCEKLDTKSMQIKNYIHALNLAIKAFECDSKNKRPEHYSIR